MATMVLIDEASGTQQVIDTVEVPSGLDTIEEFEFWLDQISVNHERDMIFPQEGLKD